MRGWILTVSVLRTKDTMVLVYVVFVIIYSDILIIHLSDLGLF